MPTAGGTVYLAGPGPAPTAPPQSLDSNAAVHDVVAPLDRTKTPASPRPRPSRLDSSTVANLDLLFASDPAFEGLT